MNQDVQRSEFLGVFYEDYIQTLIDAVIQPSTGNSTSTSSNPDDPDAVQPGLNKSLFSMVFARCFFFPSQKHTHSLTVMIEQQQKRQIPVAIPVLQ